MKQFMESMIELITAILMAALFGITLSALISSIILLFAS